MFRAGFFLAALVLVATGAAAHHSTAAIYDASRTVEVRGVEIDNLGCLAGTGRLTACGSRSGSGWSVTIERGSTDVLAQLTLTVP